MKLPDAKILIPAVITQSSVLVEHPELVADRIRRYADVVGRERIIAGSDCGFGTIAGLPTGHVSIVWRKLQSLAEGAHIASRELCHRNTVPGRKSIVSERVIKWEDRMVRHVIRSVVVAVVASVMAGTAYAQSFPTRPITVIVAQPAGSAVDAMSRVYIDVVSKSMGQPIIVENRPGGGGIIAVQDLKRSAADGHTLLVIANGPLTIEPWIRTLPYDVGRDFEPVAVLFGFSQFFVVSAESPANSVKDLVSFAKTKPGGLTYSTLGAGSITHLLCSMVARDSGTSMQHVPYTSISQYLLDLATNRVDFTFSSYQSTNSLMHENRLKYLATTARVRSALAPDVPTTAEAGFPDLNLTVWFGLLAPAGTPAYIVQKLYEEFAKASRDPQTVQRLVQDGIDGKVASPAETKALIASEGTKMDRLIREFNIRVE